MLSDFPPPRPHLCTDVPPAPPHLLQGRHSPQVCVVGRGLYLSCMNAKSAHAEPAESMAALEMRLRISVRAERDGMRLANHVREVPFSCSYMRKLSFRPQPRGVCTHATIAAHICASDLPSQKKTCLLMRAECSADDSVTNPDYAHTLQLQSI